MRISYLESLLYSPTSHFTTYLDFVLFYFLLTFLFQFVLPVSCGYVAFFSSEMGLHGAIPLQKMVVLPPRSLPLSLAPQLWWVYLPLHAGVWSGMSFAVSHRLSQLLEELHCNCWPSLALTITFHHIHSPGFHTLFIYWQIFRQFPVLRCWY